METKVHKNMIKLHTHTHTHTHICYNIVAGLVFHAKNGKTGNGIKKEEIRLNSNLVDSG